MKKQEIADLAEKALTVLEKLLLKEPAISDSVIQAIKLLRAIE